jgi:hypothetical protein
MANDTMAAALDKAGYAYHYVKNGGMHDPTPYDSADHANVLRWLWRDCAQKGSSIMRSFVVLCSISCSSLCVASLQLVELPEQSQRRS